MVQPDSTAQAWLRSAMALIERVAATQADGIETASQWCADAIGGDGLVHLFGTGHSRIPVEEMFPRYGSYPGWNPIVELSMTFHTQVVGANGQRQAMFIERTPGLAEVILSNFTFGPRDVMVVFSASGLSAVPVEMARVASTVAHLTGLPPSRAISSAFSATVSANRLEMWSRASARACTGRRRDSSNVSPAVAVASSTSASVGTPSSATTLSS